MALRTTILLVVALGLGCAEEPASEPDPMPRRDAGHDLPAGRGDAGDGGDASVPAGPGAVCEGPLDCRGVCPDYVPAPPVCDLGTSLWYARFEGDCGDYRYRFEGSWYYGSIQIWDRAGKLVASYAFTDSAVPCQQRVRGDRSVYEQCAIPDAREVCSAEDADAGTP